MPDLGAYALEVGLAYTVSIALLVFLVWISVAQARKAKASLEQAEGRLKDG